MADDPPSDAQNGWLSDVLGIDVQSYLPAAADDVGAPPAPQAVAATNDGPQYPPDWQHGAPTKPVAPDPNVWPPAPPEPGRSPYREPSPPPPEDDPGLLEEADKIREHIKQVLIGVGIGATLAGILAYILMGLAAAPALAELRKHDVPEDQVQAVASAMGWQTEQPAAPAQNTEGSADATADA